MCDLLLIKVEEAARRLGIGRSLAYRLIQKETLPSVRIAGARRIRVCDLEAFVASLQNSDEGPYE